MIVRIIILVACVGCECILRYAVFLLVDSLFQQFIQGELHTSEQSVRIHIRHESFVWQEFQILELELQFQICRYI